MIDFHTYAQLHSDSHTFKKTYSSIDDPKVKHMDPEAMASDDPPLKPDLYVFPNTIPAYNLRSKKWGKYESLDNTIQCTCSQGSDNRN